VKQVSDQDPFQTLADHRPFATDRNNDSTTAARKAAMYEEIIMETSTLEHTDNVPTSEIGGDQIAGGNPQAHNGQDSFWPRSTSIRNHHPHGRIRRTGRRAAVAVAAVAFALVATLIPLPGGGDIAYAMDALARTTQATSGRLEVVQVHTVGEEAPQTRTTSFVFDGPDAQLNETTFTERISAVVDGVGYSNIVASNSDGRIAMSALFDRERVLGNYADSLGTVESLGAMFELAESVSRLALNEDTDLITMEIPVDAGPGETYDHFETFGRLPAGMSIAPEGNFTISISVKVTGDLVDELSYTAVGTRVAPELGLEAIPFTTTGTVQFIDINEPQVIEAPAGGEQLDGVDEWSLLNDPARTAFNNFFFADDQLGDLCTDFDRNWEALLGPLTDAQEANYKGLASCLEAEFWSVSNSITTLMDQHNG